MTDETFNLFHKYNRLVRRQMVKPLECHCGGNLITSLGPEDELVLICYACDTEIVPGESRIADVRAVVKEHFND